MILFKYGFILFVLLMPFSGFGSVNDKHYYQGDYPADHWALQPYSVNDPKVIALASFHNAQYAVFLNPTDERGYRSIVMLVDNNDMHQVMNRDYISEERLGLGMLVQLMAEAYGHITPVSQTALMGNNCQQFDPDTGITYLGTAEEPCLLHAHVMGRGNPKYDYVEGVTLNGPIPGIAFLFKSKDPDVPGNDKSVAWKEGEMKKVAQRLRQEINKIKEPYATQGLIMSTVPDAGIQ
ncbi:MULTISPECIES: hypothetical protein [unclassified Legionella]|uniref:hypothetical protein n=1 Tax=unclassified Legionella TaxID=2622702 RepID=UPI00105540DE|nr:MULTISPECIES: hypothetical protein [unclassified Legionella]MDI9817999.1 hypothetical protein [Legionella sp. PL877]